MSCADGEMQPKETEIFIGGSSTEPQGAQRHSWRLLLLCTLLSLLLTVLVTLTLNLFIFPRYPTRPICLARAEDLKISKDGFVSNSTWTIENCSKHIRNESNKLIVLQDGIYVVYVHVTREAKVNESTVFFTIDLMKESSGENITLNKLNEYTPITNCSACKPHISVSLPHHLQKGDQLFLRFNGFSISKSSTFWGVYEIAPVMDTKRSFYQ